MNTGMIPPATSAAVAISCYENLVPSFVEAELDRLYGSFYSSLAHFRIYGGIENAHTYVARDGDTVVAVFLFRRERTRVQVINAGMKIEAREISSFAEYILTTFES